MNAGELSREELQRWVANRFYYQREHPAQGRGDPLQLPRGRGPPRVDPADHRPRRRPRRAAAGSSRGCGSARRSASSATSCVSERLVLPGVRYAVDAYVNFCRHEAVGRGGRLLAHRAVRPRRDQGAASRRSRRTTRGSTRPGSSTSARGSTRRRATRSTRSTSSSSAARRASSRIAPSRRSPSSATCSGRSSRRSTPATRSRRATHDAPQLATGVRLHWDKVRERHVLLYPEGALVLNPTAVDGARALRRRAHARRHRRQSSASATTAPTCKRRRRGARRRDRRARAGGRCRRLTRCC